MFQHTINTSYSICTDMYVQEFQVAILQNLKSTLSFQQRTQCIHNHTLISFCNVQGNNLGNKTHIQLFNLSKFNNSHVYLHAPLAYELRLKYQQQQYFEKKL